MEIITSISQCSPCTYCTIRCCQATFAQLATCSIPIYQNSPDMAAIFCPTPPAVMVGSQETGALDSINIYVAEHLLNVSEEVELALFFQRFAAGFVIHTPDPPYAACGDVDVNISCKNLVPARTSFQIRPEFLTTSLDPTLPCRSEINVTMNDDCDQLSPSNWSSSYDPLLEACIATYSCGPPLSIMDALVGLQSSDPPEPTRASATVWYNNQVRLHTLYCRCRHAFSS